MKTKKSLIICFVSACVFFLSACQSTSGGDDKLGWGTRAIICTGGGIAGAYVGKKLAEKFFEKTDRVYSAKEIDTYTKGFQLGLFLTFCKLADYAGNTIYKKLSEEGEKRRREQVLQAASSAQVTTYEDPSNPNLRGTVKPIKTYAESALNRECVDIEDTLVDGSSSESVYVKYCRSLPNGPYQPVTV
ncbi:hypothetical protein [Alteromonas sp. W364]|jgi:hypothetical protein|uniref:hypothetical protein n=1 Tax=Alteromonas sp. W364 TaxID=3075610 RepID=UPI0028840C5C|nr:hypothetical protein [Alteromonas sp. W364]MDT0629614.1 hypothetical protein [Alteromonas sp. W364]